MPRPPRDNFPDEFDTPAYVRYRPHWRGLWGLWLVQAAPHFVLAAGGLLLLVLGLGAALFLLPPPTTIVIVVTGQPSATPIGDVHGDFPADVVQIYITLPARIDNSLTFGERRGYRFLVAPGVRWRVRVLSDGVFDPVLSLYDPSGTLLQLDDNSGGGLSSQLTFEADQLGQYALLIESAGGGRTAGGYTLEVLALNMP